MAQLEVTSLSFTYPDGETESLRDISLTAQEGDFILLCGSTGSGKSTLLRHLKKETQPAGSRTGEILYQGKPFEALRVNGTVAEIGIVFQDPENQIVMDTVSQELAFALENIGCPPVDMHKRIGEMVQFFGIGDWLHSPIQELSGGQKQTLNLASVLLLQPKILLLDEPTSQLDPVAAKDFLQLVKRINEEFGTTIVISEHRLTELFPCANQVILMAEGEIVYQEKPRVFIHDMWGKNDKRWLYYLPRLSKTYLNMTPQNECLTKQIPLTVKEGRRWLSEQGHTLAFDELKRLHPDRTELPSKAKGGQKPAFILSCEEVFFQYHRAGRRILNSLSGHIHENEIVAILGGNGTGKTTLLKILLGLLKPQKGRVLFRGEPVLKIKETRRFHEIGYLDQNPKLYFLHDTVEQVLNARALQLSMVHKDSGVDKSRGMDKCRSQRRNLEERITEIIEELRLPNSCMKRHPYDLSGGEQQKLALALVLMAEPSVLLLDEPTKGLDPHAKSLFGGLLQEFKQRHLSLVLVSHDIEFVEEYATQCCLLFDGRLTEGCPPQEFFSGNYFYTTPTHRLFHSYTNSLVEQELRG